MLERVFIIGLKVLANSQSTTLFT